MEAILEKGRKRMKADIYNHNLINGDKASPTLFRKFRDPLAYGGEQGVIIDGELTKDTEKINKAAFDFIKGKLGEEEIPNPNNGGMDLEGFLNKYNVILPKVNNPPPPEVYFTPDRVKLAFKKLKPKAQGGPDHLNFEWTNFLLNMAPKFVCQALKNEAVSPSQGSKKLRDRIISLVPKRGDKLQVKKAFRPIALLNNLQKIIDHIICQWLKDLIFAHKLLPNNSFAFRPFHSCQEALILMGDIINITKIQNKEIFVLCQDFENAYESISKDYLIKILQKMNIPPPSSRPTSKFLVLPQLKSKEKG